MRSSWHLSAAAVRRVLCGQICSFGSCFWASFAAVKPLSAPQCAVALQQLRKQRLTQDGVDILSSQLADLHGELDTLQVPPV